MKKKYLISLAIGVALGAGNVAFGKGGTIKSDEKKYLESYGWVVGSQSGLTQLGLTDSEIEAIIEGFRKAAHGEKSTTNLQEMSSGMQKYLQAKAETYQEIREKQLEKEAIANKKAAGIFYSKLDKNPKIKKTANGLYYQVISKGSDERPTANSLVKINYVGTLINGNVFDSSKERGEPVEFNLKNVIPGFKEGLQHVGKSGCIKLYIPPELAYGNQDLPGIPPGSTLVFEVDMLDIMPTEEEEV